MRYTEAQAKQIMLEARATIAGVRADQLRWRAEGTRQRDGAIRFVTKTNDCGLVAVPDPAPPQQSPIADEQTMDAVEWLLGQVVARLQQDFEQALEKRDREIRSLRREIKMLRDEVGLERGLENLKAQVDEARQQARNHEVESLQRELGTLRNEIELKLSLKSDLAAARTEVEELRQRAPSFEHQLNGLQGHIEKVQKTTLRLRAEHSTLEYQQKQLDAELSQMKRKAASAAVVEFETSTSRITVGNLHPDAANALREFASQVIDAEDGGAILFSGSVGTA
jgi:predicted RNase H-like nuclease (RuvC/YqgF family)